MTKLCNDIFMIIIEYCHYFDYPRLCLVNKNCRDIIRNEKMYFKFLKLIDEHRTSFKLGVIKLRFSVSRKDAKRIFYFLIEKNELQMARTVYSFGLFKIDVIKDIIYEREMVSTYDNIRKILYAKGMYFPINKHEYFSQIRYIDFLCVLRYVGRNSALKEIMAEKLEELCYYTGPCNKEKFIRAVILCCLGDVSDIDKIFIGCCYYNRLELLKFFYCFKKIKRSVILESYEKAEKIKQTEVIEWLSLKK